MKRLQWLSAAAVLLSAQCAVFAQEAAAPVDESISLWDLISQGGWAMIPLGLCSFLLIALITVNFMQVNQKKMIPAAALDKVKSAAAQKNVYGVIQAAQESESFFTKALATGMRHYDSEDVHNTKTRVEDAIAEVVSRQESQTSFWINFLSLIAAIAPMLGLLGTVSGMIGAFQKISGGGMGKPELLAGNIGEALITTATGLTIAIPAMFFYFLFKNILNRILVAAEEQYSIILDDITGMHQQ